MFQFFVKKYFLIDYLKDFVDIHNHILPGIDDGARTVEDSIDLIRAFGEVGINKFIATPHIMHNYYDNDKTSIHASLESLRSELLEQHMVDISIEAAAEHMIDNNFESLLESKGVMPMRKEYLLVEMSYLQPSINFDEAIIQTVQQGYFPILAHPERYIYLQSRMNKYRKYKEQGILFQLNLLSLGEYYSPETTACAKKLLEADLIDFVGSDVHNLRQFNAIKELSINKRLLKKIQPLIYNTIETFF